MDDENKDKNQNEEEIETKIETEENKQTIIEDIELEEIEENSLVKIKDLKEKIKKCEAEKQDYLIGWQRAKADHINSRKNEEKLREDYIAYKTENILLNFLDVLDAFHEAFKNNGFQELAENYKKGIEAIFNKFSKVLEYHNVKPYDSLGEIFNPALHEGLITEEIEDTKKDNIVLEEFQKGYKINERVLRPAKVKVGIYKKK